MTENDGSTSHKARQPKYVPTLLEQLGLGTESTANQYCKAIDDYLNKMITLEQCFAIMGTKRVIEA